MAENELQVTPRETFGKKVRALRRHGLIPAIIYGHGISSTPVQVDAKTLHNVVSRAGRNTLISLKLDGGKPRNVFIRDVQRHPLNGSLLHVDFYQVKMTEKMKAEVPVVLTGSSPAVEEKGGVLIHGVDAVEVESLPADLPHSINVDISRLEDFDEIIHVRDLRVGKGVTVLSDPDQVIAQVARPRVEEEVAPAPAAEEEVVPAAPAEEAGAPAEEEAS